MRREGCPGVSAASAPLTPFVTQASCRNSLRTARCGSESRGGQDVAKLAYLLRILPEPVLDHPVYRSLWKRPVRCPFTGHPLHQQLDPLVDVADRPDVETSR